MWLCSICSQLFGRGSERVCTTKCGHVYHCDCILEWLETANSCPECREYCSTDDITMIYLNSSVESPERIDEVKRLSGLQTQALEYAEKIATLVKSKIPNIVNMEERKTFSTEIVQEFNKLRETIVAIDDVSTTLADLHLRARDIVERFEANKDSGQGVKTLSEFSAKLQRDIDCYASNFRKVQAEAYENSLSNVTLRSEKNSVECELSIVNEKVNYLSTCIDLLRKEVTEKQKTVREEIEAKRKLIIECHELHDKNRELLTKLETSEAGVIPVLNTIKRLNSIISEKCELITLHTRRIKELNFTIDDMDKKMQSQNIESIAKIEEKDEIIREQKRRLAMYAMQCDELSDKVKALERKIYFYEAVIRGVVDRKGEPESPRLLRLALMADEIEEKKSNPANIKS